MRESEPYNVAIAEVEHNGQLRASLAAPQPRTMMRSNSSLI